MTLDVAPLLGPRGRAFTDEQARAVLDDGGDLLLSAAAGSGKTSVLVERFVRHVLEEGVAPGRILAITFTEKAAGEMKQRVRERLLELAARDAATDPAAARRAREAARESEGAWISTIHGFCARLLRGHAVSAGIDPGFAVLDEPSARTLRDAAWEHAFGTWLEERGEPALDVAAGFTADRLRAAVVEVHDALRSAGSTAPRLPAPPPAPDPDPSVLRTAADAALAELADGTGATVERARRALERCGEMLDAGDLPGPGALDKSLFKPGNVRALQGDAVAAYLAARESFAGACAHHRAVGALAELDDLLARYGEAYAARKRARSSLDFDDLELLARDLLRDAPSVRDAYAERFERILVDELQDSNPLQIELFDLLAGPPLFLVGDELQSIYGFRHADVGVFRDRRARLAEDDRALALTVNFRSHPEILDVVNAAFGERFGDAFAPLVPGVEEGRGAGDPRVELLITGTKGWEDVDLGALPRTQRWRHAEARLVAQRLRDLVDAGEASPEEIVVLVRATGDLPVYERALEDAGLQTLASGGRGYWGRQVVRDLCAWLAALANPSDEHALFGVLASPLVGASTDALALVAEAGTGRAWRLVDAAFGEATETAPPEDAERARVEELARALPGRLAAVDRERLAAFRDRFAAERALASRLPLDVLLRRAVEASDYDLHVLRLPGGARRLANVHKLLRLAAEHERAHGSDVRGLVDRANAELEADAREADAPVELGDAKAVRLMTIHAAKGLEFPVVCVADLGRRTSTDAPALLVRGDSVGVRLSHLDGSSECALDYVALRDARREAERREEDRILYVALTRAERRLILSGGVDLAKWPGDSLGAPPLAWLGPALLDGLAAVPGEEEPAAGLDGGAAERSLRGGGDAAGGGAVRLRCAINTPATVGRVLREASLAPGGADLPLAPPPPARPALAPPPAPEPSVRSLSYSALEQWRRCGYRFYLQRVLGLPQEDAPFRSRGEGGGLEGRVRGTLVHEVLERLEPRNGAAAADLLDAAAARHGDQPVPAERDALLRLVLAYAATPLAERVARAGRVRKEHPFALPLGASGEGARPDGAAPHPTRDAGPPRPARGEAPLLTGVVDVLAIEDDGSALIVDYKTDRLAPDEDLRAHVERDYGVQLRAYALAALSDGHPSVEVAYAFLERPEAPVIAAFDATDAPRLRAELENLAAGALTGDFPVTDTPHADLCAGCPGRRALCSHPEELTGRELPLATGG
ncbi:MAG TPA: UvrD-helicase domain-containing protein [Solirubrobacteraceae bacterium]